MVEQNAIMFKCGHVIAARDIDGKEEALVFDVLHPLPIDCPTCRSENPEVRASKALLFNTYIQADYLLFLLGIYPEKK